MQEREMLDIHWKMMMTIRWVKEYADCYAHPFCENKRVTQQQMQILIALYFEGPQTITGLARCVHMAGANNSTLCKKLEQQGHVSRQRDKKDERQVVVSLTEPGEKLVNEFMQENKQRYVSILEQISDEDMETIWRGFEKLEMILKLDKETTR